MGVKNLWKLISPIKEIVKCENEFKNKILAIDLSIWLFQFINTKINNTKIKLHSRNLKLRINHFIKYNCQLIFIRYLIFYKINHII